MGEVTALYLYPSIKANNKIDLQKSSNIYETQGKKEKRTEFPSQITLL